MNRPPSQRVLSIPELLHRIFLHATTHDNFSNLRVCKLWSNEVLSIEWSEVDEPQLLFELLAPLEPATDDPYRFTRHLHPRDWERFEHYAWRVKHLTLIRQEHYSPSAFLEIASGRPRLALLPNLHKLSIFPNPTIFQVFANSTVKSLELCLGSLDDTTLGILATLCHVPVRMPALQHLFLNVGYPDIDLRKFESMAPSAFAALFQLKALVLPSSWLSPGVTQVISKLEYLESLDSTGEDMINQWPDSTVFSDQLEAGGFPSLTDLALVIPIGRAAACLSGTYKPSGLSTLELFSAEVVPVEDYRQIIEAISSGCPKLKVFQLEVAVRDLPQDYTSPPVQFPILKPILACRDLQVLRLSHQLPLDIDEGNIVAIIQSLPSLLELSLNPFPTRASPPTLHVSCLSAIAPFSMSLQRLELYMDTAHDKIPEYDEEDSLQYLEYLIVGLSPLESNSTIPVALYLSNALPAECVIAHSHPYSADPKSVYKCWWQVHSLLPAFRKAQRIAERRVMRRQASTASKA